jgi:CheY-like chemotaxis protein
MTPLASRNIRILWVEDEKVFFADFAAVLRQRGHDVRFVDNTESCAVILRDHLDDIDLLILDVMVPLGLNVLPSQRLIPATASPDVAGVALLRYLRRQLASDLPAIVISGVVDEVARPKSTSDLKALGVAEIFIKPPDLFELLEAIALLFPEEASPEQ